LLRAQLRLFHKVAPLGDAQFVVGHSAAVLKIGTLLCGSV
jgi:hypothetical protein